MYRALAQDVEMTEEKKRKYRLFLIGGNTMKAGKSKYKLLDLFYTILSYDVNRENFLFRDLNPVHVFIRVSSAGPRSPEMCSNPGLRFSRVIFWSFTSNQSTQHDEIRSSPMLHP